MNIDHHCTDKPGNLIRSMSLTDTAGVLPEIAFERLLQPRDPNSGASSGTQGDDYYWQHQHQLQQSALTFLPEETQTEKTPLPLNENKPSTLCEQMESQSISKLNHDQFKTDETPWPVLPKGISPPPWVPTGFMAKENKAQAINPLTAVSDLIQVETKKSPGQVPCLLLPRLPGVVFKNHQMFLNEHNEAELALHTLPLSKQQSGELQRLIKQWLADKGYVLKQLIINGAVQ